MQYQIPKRIVQFRIGKHVNQTLRDRAITSNIRLLNSDYEYLFFDDARVEEFIEREFPSYRQIFDSFPFAIQRCDFFRYLAVYRYGGFYFDSDVLLASSLSDLLDCGCVFPFETLNFSHFMRSNLRMDWQIGNYAFGAAQGHSFLEAIIKNCIKAQRDPGWVKPMMRGSPLFIKDEYLIINSTGPGLVSRTLAENPGLAKEVTVLFPDDVCDVRNWNRFGDHGIHLMDSSWRASRGFMRQKFTNICRNWLRQRRLKESLRLGKSRYHPGGLLVCSGAEPDGKGRLSARK
jgi:mannosyltransferase OCH1-like enzyme